MGSQTSTWRKTLRVEVVTILWGTPGGRLMIGGGGGGMVTSVIVMAVTGTLSERKPQ